MILREERIGDCRLILGDCLQVMPLLGRVDAVVTDPPYGIGFGAKHTKWSANRSTKLGTWDGEIPDIAPLLDVADALIVWGGERFSLPVRRRWLTWVKPDAAPTFASTEYAWTSMDAPARHFVYAVGAVNQERVGHPTQKPVALMEWCLGFLPDAKTILDPFMGSGTTLVACQRLGRQGIGIELDPDYFAIACKRVDEATRQPDLFITPPAPKPTQETLL
jgi:DNA modification methylase